MKRVYLILLIFVTVFLIKTNIAWGQSMSDRLAGRILLQVEEKGEAWYVNPTDQRRYFLGRPEDAFQVMQDLGLGVSNTDLGKIPVGLVELSGTDSDKDSLIDIFEDALGTDKFKADSDSDGYSDSQELSNGFNPVGTGKIVTDQGLIDRLKGKILLQVEGQGEAWYLNPVDGKRYYLSRPKDAFEIMRKLGLGITNQDLNKILVSSLIAGDMQVGDGQGKVDTAPVPFQPDSEFEVAVVSDVIDKSTIRLLDGRTVSLIGIGLSNSNYFSDRAKDELATLIQGKEVFLQKDDKLSDIASLPGFEDYYIVSRYVFVDSLFVNEWLIKQGYVDVIIVPGAKYIDILNAALEEAKNAQRGIWGADTGGDLEESVCPSGMVECPDGSCAESLYDCPEEEEEIEVSSYSDALDIALVNNSTEDTDLNSEYFILRNDGNQDINIEDWKLYYEEDKYITLPSKTVPQGGAILIYSKEGTNTEANLYLNKTREILYPEGGEIILMDRDNNKVLSYKY